MPGLGGPETMVFRKARKMAEGSATLVNNITFDETLNTYTSGSTVCRWYWMYTLLVSASVVGQPTKIRITPEFSWDGGTTWYPLHMQPPEIIEFEDTEVAEEMARVGTFRKCYDGLTPGWLMRARVDAYGVDRSNMFTISIYVWFRS